MKALSVVDAAFLQLETPATPMHVGAVFIMDPPRDRRGDYAELLREHLRARLGNCEVFTRRLAPMPLNLANPLWVEHGEVDLDYHICSRRLRGPVTRRALDEQVARLHSKLLDRSLPLWEIHVLEGLPRGRIALYLKMHHAGLDGASALAFMRTIVDQADGPPPRAEPEVREAPGVGEVVAQGLRHQLEEFARLPEMLGTLAAGAVEALRRKARTPRQAATPPRPHTPFNRVIGSARSIATFQLPLADAKAVARALGGTVNDVVLAVSAGALRQYLLARKALPDAPLTAAVPVSLREAGNVEHTIQVTFMGVDLHTDMADRAARFEAIHRSAAESKEMTQALKSLMPRDLPSLGLPWVLGAVVRALATPMLVDHAPLPFNVLVSNVPGPQQRVSIAGAQVRVYSPISIPYHGAGLNITVHSYDGQLFFGLTACRRAVPDAAALARDITAEFRALASVAARRRQAPDDRPARPVEARRKATAAVKSRAGVTRRRPARQP